MPSEETEATLEKTSTGSSLVKGQEPPTGRGGVPPDGVSQDGDTSSSLLEGQDPPAPRGGVPPDGATQEG